VVAAVQVVVVVVGRNRAKTLPRFFCPIKDDSQRRRKRVGGGGVVRVPERRLDLGKPKNFPLFVGDVI